MLNFLNFSAKQLQETEGFRKKITKVASNLNISKLKYFEIINIEENALDVLLIDNNMYFSKVHLYSSEAIKMLNSEFERIVSSLGVSGHENFINSVEKTDDTNLLSSVLDTLSRSMQLLNIENSNKLDKLEESTSSEFNVGLDKFSYVELKQAIIPIVKELVPNMHSVKIINLTSNSIEILLITEECKLYQYTIFLDISYQKFFNRYLSAILPYELFIEMKKGLKLYDFSTALKAAMPSYDSINKKNHVEGFISFLIKTFKSKTKDEGHGKDGLKNVYKFFLDTSVDEAEAKKKVLDYFMKSSTFINKK